MDGTDQLKINLPAIILAACALDKDTVRVVAERGDGASVIDVDLALGAGRAGTPGRVLECEPWQVCPQASGQASAPTHALSENADGTVSHRDDATGTVDGHRAAISARATVATESQTDTEIGRCSERTKGRHTALNVSGHAAPATDTLREDAVGAFAMGDDVAG